MNTYDVKLLCKQGKCHEWTGEATNLTDAQKRAYKYYHIRKAEEIRIKRL